ncbi:hypothetical protein PMAYCL1PPCAC_05139, partial [Pristionchus mayeri]
MIFIDMDIVHVAGKQTGHLIVDGIVGSIESHSKKGILVVGFSGSLKATPVQICEVVEREIGREEQNGNLENYSGICDKSLWLLPFCASTRLRVAWERA